jgi:rhomboid protease GluP
MLIALNVAVFAMEATLARSLSDLSPRLALELGASYGLATVGEFRWETLVTACFLHAGLMHLVFNMLVLWYAVPLVERVVGSARLAPMYLAAGVFGNALSIAYSLWQRHHTGVFTLGASGAICGVIAAALAYGWRTQGWSGPLTQAMARWLGLVVVVGVLSSWIGSGAGNVAHIGGVLAGAMIGGLWRRDVLHSDKATRAILTGCAAVLVACIAVVAMRDRADPFATLVLGQRSDFTREALADGRCGDALAGLAAVERLRAPMAPVTSLRTAVEETCGHSETR